MKTLRIFKVFLCWFARLYSHLVLFCKAPYLLASSYFCLLLWLCASNFATGHFAYSYSNASLFTAMPPCLMIHSCACFCTSLPALIPLCLLLFLYACCFASMPLCMQLCLCMSLWIMPADKSLIGVCGMLTMLFANWKSLCLQPCHP